MRKLFVIVVAMLLVGSFAFAADITTSGSAMGISIEPVAVLHSYKDLDNTVGGGVAVNLSNIGIENLKVGGGFEMVTADLSENTVPYAISAIPVTINVNGNESLDIKDLYSQIGYDFKLADKLTLTPLIGLHYLFVDADNMVDAKNAFGFSIGGQAAYEITKDISILAGLGYQWAETKLMYPSVDVLGVSVAAADQKVSLDNLNATLGVKVQF